MMAEKKYAPIRGSWGHDPGVPGDVYIAGAPTAAQFQAMPGNPPGFPKESGYGEGITAEKVNDNLYRLRLSLVAYGTRATTGSYTPYVYAGTLGAEYDWQLIVAKTTVQTEDPASAPYTHAFTEPLKQRYYGSQPLYAMAGWNNPHSATSSGGTWYNDVTKNTFDATNITWLKITIYGDDTFPLAYSYIQFKDIIDDYRPMAIRKNGAWKSLDNIGGFWQIRKSGKWIDVPKTSFSDDGKPNKSANQIRKSRTWKAQSKIGG